MPTCGDRAVVPSTRVAAERDNPFVVVVGGVAGGHGATRAPFETEQGLGSERVASCCGGGTTAWREASEGEDASGVVEHEEGEGGDEGGDEGAGEGAGEGEREGEREGAGEGGEGCMEWDGKDAGVELPSEGGADATSDANGGTAEGSGGVGKA